MAATERSIPVGESSDSIGVYLTERTVVALLRARGWTVDPRLGYGASHPVRGRYWLLSDALAVSLGDEAWLSGAVMRAK